VCNNCSPARGNKAAPHSARFRLQRPRELRSLELSARWGIEKADARVLPLALGHRGKCPEPYTREEKLVDQLAASLGELVDSEKGSLLVAGCAAQSDLTEQAAREKEIRRLEEQHRRVDARLEAMYEDKLEGRITAEFFDRKAAEHRNQKEELLRRIDTIRASAPAPVEQAIVMDLTSRAADLFRVQPVHEQQRFLRLVLKSPSWQDGRVQTVRRAVPESGR
jgi:hypothetical protein